MVDTVISGDMDFKQRAGVDMDVPVRSQAEWFDQSRSYRSYSPGSSPWSLHRVLVPSSIRYDADSTDKPRSSDVEASLDLLNRIY
jgi:hypothetical protein